VFFGNNSDMLFPTHILLGIVFFLITKNFFIGNDYIAFFLVLLGSILPDIDSKHSKINQWSGFIGKIVVFFSKHRGLWHSVFLHGLLFTVVWNYFNVYYASALFVGYFAHLVGDGITPMGVKLFYPFSDYKIKGPIKVGGWFESLLMVLLVVMIWVRLF
jgi:inner membrane protein